MESKIQTANCKPSWTDLELDRLGKALTFCYRNATEKFGNELDLQIRIDGFKFTLQDTYTMEQVLSSFKVFMKKSTKMIGTADVEEILNPEPAKITAGQYYTAQERQKRNGYPSFSPEAILIREYENQEAAARDPKPDAPMHPQLASKLKDELGKTPELKTIGVRR